MSSIKCPGCSSLNSEVLFELAGAAPLSVAVYGSDFYLGRQIYDRSSPDSISVKK